MTPKEKAEDLYFKMMQHAFGGDSKSAKQCALIAVEEILNAHAFKKASGHKTFWLNVRKEIEKL